MCQIYLKGWFSISTKNGIGIENVLQILIKNKIKRIKHFLICYFKEDDNFK
jgi:hypothetical protein